MPGGLCCSGSSILQQDPGHVSRLHVSAGIPSAPRSCPCAAVVASEKGVVVGRLTFQEDGDVIDCARMGVGGKAIPPNVDKVRFHNSAA